MILNIILFIVILISAIIFHEIGHLIYIKKYGGEAVLKFDGDPYAEVPDGLTKKQENKIITAGVIAGGIPLFFGLFWLDPLFSFTAIACYMVGCKGDIKQLN